MEKMQNQKREILLVPVGKVLVDVLSEMAVALRKVYKFHVHIGRSEEPDMNCYSDSRRQYDAEKLLGFIATKKRENLVAVLGIVDGDMFAGEKSFIFGGHYPGKGVAVLALSRLREDFYKKTSNIELFYRRAVTEAIYQIGLSIGIPVCPNKKCALQASASLWRLDEKGQQLCGLCQERLEKLFQAKVRTPAAATDEDDNELNRGPESETVVMGRPWQPADGRQPEDESSVAEEILTGEELPAAETAAIHPDEDETDQ